ncbi:MAG: hypothetical protein ACE5JU_06375 [Candidatus Binatia bacterium]
MTRETILDIFLGMLKELRRVLVLALVLSLLLSLLNVGAAQDQAQQELPPAEPTEEETAGQDFGYGVGSVIASVFYSPLKLTYAGLGLITGGIGFVLSAGRADVANNIIYPAIRGNYVITPSHLKGVEPVIFIGPPPPTDSALEPSPAPDSLTGR